QQDPPGDAARTTPDEVGDKLKKKELKRLLDAARPLDSWERYRALNDATDEAYDLIDISNREARFALIVMGGLNAMLFVVGTRSDLPQQLTAVGRTVFSVAIALYALLAAYFLFQAIELLRPRRFRPHPHLSPVSDDRDEIPLGIRYYEDVVMRDVDGHLQAWRDVRIGQLNAELAIQLHSLCLTNKAKHVALRRLYDGLRAITLLVSVTAALFAYLVWV
ncbi:MAG: hypothetical protein ACRDQ2_02335, partial [Gaiellales bacterium]